MSVVTPLPECIARPGERPGGLISHLEAVACGCGVADGTPEQKLAFLAGLAHDAGKAAREWQNYIRSAGKIIRGPPHAPLGAALFALWAETLIDAFPIDTRGKERLHDLAIDWVRLLYRHHGELDDLSDRPPWVAAFRAANHEPPALLETCDRAGLDRFVAAHLPECAGRLGDFEQWFENADRRWSRRQRVIRPDLLRKCDEGDRDRWGLRLAHLGSRLIYADRRHAAEWEPEEFASDAAAAAIHRHAETCRQAANEARARGADEDLLTARGTLQDTALHAFRQDPSRRVFTLLLPTGYGKTLTGLRVALEAVATRRCRRLIYVAPYISILSQAAQVIEQASGLPVFLHHHLSILSLDDDPTADRQAEDHQPYELLDTWQAPILATTFNQFFGALFPVRAQDCLRIPALDGAFVFIDEPQIVDPAVWCAFLRALAVLGRERGCQILFTTATLPPLEEGLGPEAAPYPLVAEVKPAVSRYVIHTSQEPWQVARVAEEAQRQLDNFGSVAVILNTVRDAVDVFRKLSHGALDWYFLSAAMLPGHKSLLIQTIRDRLSSEPDRWPTGVVCTQVLEAGVDLSFRALLRASAVLPSIGQAAGRANRHGESNPADVQVFPFIRDDGTLSRKFVYRDGLATTHTDRLLAQHPDLAEMDLGPVLAEYYRGLWEQNPHTTSLQWFSAAALGRWSELAGLEPFGGSYPQTEVVVPGAESYLPERYRPELAKFGVATIDGLIDLSCNRDSRRELSLFQRKRLSALVRQFVVALPQRVAERVASPVRDCVWLWRLDDPNEYAPDTGLAHCLLAEEDRGVIVL